MVKISITEWAQAISCTQNHKVLPFKEHNCDEVSKCRHSRGSFSSYQSQSRVDVGTCLRIMSRG